MPGLLLTGVNSEICGQLLRLVECETTEVTREKCDMLHLNDVDDLEPLLREHDRIVIAHGKIDTDPFLSRRPVDVTGSFIVNCMSVVRMCELAIAVNPKVRIVVIGSESATKGSFDIPYWLSKSALNSYVRERRLRCPEQQLVCVSPSGVDCGMTKRRIASEQDILVSAHPKHRLATPMEVARLIHFLLFVDEGYITNTVVEINGGKFARRM